MNSATEDVLAHNVDDSQEWDFWQCGMNVANSERQFYKVVLPISFFDITKLPKYSAFKQRLVVLWVTIGDWIHLEC